MDAAQEMMLAEYVLERARQRLLEQPPTPKNPAGRESQWLLRRLQEIRTTFESDADQPRHLAVTNRPAPISSAACTKTLEPRSARQRRRQSQRGASALRRHHEAHSHTTPGELQPPSNSPGLAPSTSALPYPASSTRPIPPDALVPVDARGRVPRTRINGTSRNNRPTLELESE